MQIAGLIYQNNIELSNGANKTLEKELKISFSTYLILKCLEDNPDGAHQRTIAKFVGITESAISQQLFELQNKKYIVIAQDMDDRRKNVVLQSKKGYRLLGKAKKILKSEFNKKLKYLTPEEKKILRIYLKKLYKIILKVNQESS